MNQLSLRGFDKELARREGVSLTKAALLLMCRGACIGDETSPASAIGNALDEFIGVWSSADEKRFPESIEIFETVDLVSGTARTTNRTPNDSSVF